MSAPVFGKRNLGSSPAARPASAAVADDTAAFFAAARAELSDTSEERRLVVPRSFKAASLAGLVVGCGLAGFAVTDLGADASVSTFAPINAALGLPAAATPIDLGPAQVLLGLFRGGEIASLTLIVVNSILNAIGVSSRTAYAVGGGACSSAVAAALLVGLGRPPAHGWIIELAAGAAAGFLYRAFAGVRPAT